MPVSMTQRTPPPAGPAGRVRSLWFGMRCDFTRQALAGALEPGSCLRPAAIVLPRGPRPQSAGWPAPPFERWLAERGIAVIEVDRLAGADLAAVLDLIAGQHLALGVGACCPMKVPARLRTALPGGVLNIHPSLLPALRGPEPVFHAYRLGLSETGVTIHQMDAGWDSGPVLAQERVAIPEAEDARAFEARLARIGGRWLGDRARAWCASTITPVPQQTAQATWAPVPAGELLRVPASLSVAQAARFVTAAAAAFGPLIASDADTGRLVPVTAVTASRHEPGVVRMRCRNGDLWLRR